MNVRLAVVLALAVAASTVAAPPRFRHARPITPAESGANGLVVDVPLLAGARPLRFDGGGRLVGGLEDLRLFTANGAEVPYLVVAQPVPTPQWTTGRIVPILGTDEWSGFEVDLASAQAIDRVRLTGIPGPFMKRARVEGSGDRARWIVLAAEATLFDLPAERLRRTEVAFEPQTLRYVRVTWDDRNSARVPPPTGATAELAEETAAPAPARFQLAVERRPSEPGTSRFRLRLPGPGLPIRALEFECGGDHLLRGVRVTEPQLAGTELAPRELGAGTLRRAVRDDLVAADLHVAIIAPREPELEIVVDDGDNPPLELQSVWAEMPALPWIYFERVDGAGLTARFGDPALGAPRYDIEAMRDRVRGAAPPLAAWGDVVAEAEPTPEPPAEAGDGVPAVGAGIDVAQFRYLRAVPDGPPGLTAIRLDAAALAHSPSLADLRLVDDADRQIPYIIERIGEPTSIDLDAPTPLPPGDGRSAARESRYRVSMPYERLPNARLVVETTARVFERQLGLVVEESPADRRSELRLERVRTLSWRHGDPDTPASALTIEVPPLDTTAVILTVDDGDNQPLPLVKPRLLLPTYRVRFVRTGDGPLTLVYGARDVTAPRYDLALLAPRLLGASASELVPEPEEESTLASRDQHGTVRERQVFWGALTVAVAALLVVLARLLRVEQPAA